MRSRSVLLSLAAVCLAAATLAGCSGDGTSPSGGGDPAAAEEQAAFALDFLDGLIAGAPDLASGNLAGAFAKALRPPASAPAGPARSHCFDDGVCDDVEPFWDASAGAWTASCETEDATCHLAFGFFVQFLDAGGTPHAEPGKATERIVSRTRIHASFDEPAGASSRGPFVVDYEDAMEISGLHDAEPAVTGSGSMAGSSGDEAVAMAWSYGLTFPAGGGCPSGTAVLEIGPYTITATYSGGSAYTVVITENGRVIRERTGTSQCDRSGANGIAIAEAGTVFGGLDSMLELTADMIPRVPSGPLRLELDPAGRWGAGLRGDCASACNTILLEWSQTERAYVGRCSVSDFGCDIFVELVVRYLTAGGDPQQAPDAATAHVDLDTRFVGRFLVDLDEGDGVRVGRVSDDIRNEIDVDTTQKPYAVGGAGSHEFSVVGVDGDEVLAERKSVWALDLGLPLDRDCMTGVIDLAFGPYDAFSRYDGTELRTWELFRGRERIIGEKTASDCVR
jgi:hypothetical protein